MKFTPDIKFVNDETLNEFIVTIERRDVGESYAKMTEIVTERTEIKETKKTEKKSYKKQGIRMKNKNYQDSILKYQLKLVPLQPLIINKV